MEPKLKISLRIKNNALVYKVTYQHKNIRCQQSHTSQMYLFRDEINKVTITSFMHPAIYYNKKFIHLYIKGKSTEVIYDKEYLFPDMDPDYVKEKDPFKKAFYCNQLNLKNVRSRILKAVKKYNET